MSRRSHYLAGWLGFFVISYDGALATIVMAPAFSYFVAPGADPLFVSALILTNFNASKLGRPLGAWIFGRMVDGGGGARAAVISAIGYGLLLVACALLPGYEQVGYASIGLMLALRAATGIFLAGQSVAFAPALIAGADAHRRWLVGALLPTGSSAAYIAVCLMTLAILALLPATDPGSPYVVWGWRVAFLLGALVSLLCFVLAIRLGGRPARKPLRKPSVLPVPAPLRRSAFLRILVLLAGVQLVLSTSVAALPGYLVQGLFYPANAVTAAVLSAYAVMALGYVAMGWLSQRFGSARIFILWAVASTLLGSVILHLIAGLDPATEAWLALGGLIVVTVFTLSVAGFMHTYTVEAFDPAVLATSYGTARGLAEFVPVLSGPVLLLFGLVAGPQQAPSLLLASGGLLVITGALWVQRLPKSSSNTGTSP